MISTNLCAENASFSQGENASPIQPDWATSQSAAGGPIPAAGPPPLKSPESEATDRVDERESLVNECKTGAIEEVALPQGRITRLHGIMLDFDLDLHTEAAFPPGALDTPEAFFERGLKPLLDREEVFRSAEVRVSGRGLHVILRFRSRLFASSRKTSKLITRSSLQQKSEVTSHDISGRKTTVFNRTVKGPP
jgi:hypothetical protein